MGIQVTVLANQIQKQALGYQAISLTHFAPSDTAEPSIVAGSKAEVGGALYEFTGDEAGTGWAGVGVSNTAYLYLVPAGASISWAYSTTGPTWDTAKQGWYNGSDRCFGFLWKDAGGLYQAKELLGPLTASLGKLRHLPLNNTLSRTLGPYVLPAAGNWYAAAITAAGAVGVPGIAKGIRVRVKVSAISTAGAWTTLTLSFSDNNGNVPTDGTAHPCVEISTYADAALRTIELQQEIDIPLSSAGTFYFYTITATNTNVLNDALVVTRLGYYMGD